MRRIQRLHRRTLGSNRYWQVHFDHIRDANTSEVNDYLVISPKFESDKDVIGVGILPILRGSIVLIPVYRYPIGLTAYEMPRGFREPGEGTTDAALRELREEVGLECGSGELTDYGTVAPESGTIAGLLKIYVATACSGDLRTEDGGGDIGMGPPVAFTPDELIQLISEGGILDVQTLYAVYRYLGDRVD